MLWTITLTFKQGTLGRIRWAVITVLSEKRCVGSKNAMDEMHHATFSLTPLEGAPIPLVHTQPQ